MSNKVGRFLCLGAPCDFSERCNRKEILTIFLGRKDYCWCGSCIVSFVWLEKEYWQQSLNKPPWGQMCFRILERQSILHNPPCKHQHSPVIKHINVSARKYMNIPHRNSFTSIQVGFCHRMNSGQIRLYLQIRDGKSLGFKAFWLLELRLGHCEPILY